MTENFEEIEREVRKSLAPYLGEEVMKEMVIEEGWDIYLPEIARKLGVDEFRYCANDRQGLIALKWIDEGLEVLPFPVWTICTDGYFDGRHWYYRKSQYGWMKEKDVAKHADIVLEFAICDYPPRNQGTIRKVDKIKDKKE